MPTPEHELNVEIERLRRRLERERATRLQAETIAEKGLRDLYERQRQLGLLERIATAANQSASVGDVLQFALAEICEFAEWDVGHSYLPTGAGDSLRLQSTRIWYAAEGVSLDSFRPITEIMEFAPGIGLPGRALATGKPLSINDVTEDDNFPRLAFARATGIKGASAFPVLSGSEVVAVLEFFTRVPRAPDAALLDLLSQVGLQLGRVIERKRAEDRLREQAEHLARARDEARAADRAKSAFLANMSHELRTPLNAIIGLSEVIRDELFGVYSPKYKGYAGDINESGLHLKKVLNDILDISKVEVGRLELREELVSIEEAIEACQRIIAAMAEAAGILLSFHVLDALPIIRSEQVRFKQILLNLMSNAVKFTPRGGKVDVFIEAGDGVLICVEDTGIGMSPDDIVVALEPFGQVDRALNRRHEGTGLGLPLTKALVELHGGRLDIESVPEKGTKVSLRFPPERLFAAPPIGS